jgi:hypothetical protein
LGTEPGGIPVNLPSGELAEQPSIIGFPVIFRSLFGFFHQLFQQQESSWRGNDNMCSTTITFS